MILSISDFGIRKTPPILDPLMSPSLIHRLIVATLLFSRRAASGTPITVSTFSLLIRILSQCHLWQVLFCHTCKQLSTIDSRLSQKIFLRLFLSFLLTPRITRGIPISRSQLSGPKGAQNEKLNHKNHRWSRWVQKSRQ
jgi:hypothetical protein